MRKTVMSHQIRRLRCTVLTAASAGRNFPSTMYAQSSTEGQAAATPGAPSAEAAQKAAKAGALAHLKPHRLSRRAEMHYAAAVRIDSLHSKAAEPGEIVRPGWPVLGPDKRKPLNGRNARRPTRAILIGWLLRPRQDVKTRRPCRRDYGSIPTHTPEVSPGHSMDAALKVDGAQRKAGRLASCFLCGIRFNRFAARTLEKESFGVSKLSRGPLSRFWTSACGDDLDPQLTCHWKGAR